MVTASVQSDSHVLAGKYRIIAEIGRGGMADVYLAVNRAGVGGFQKLVVVKLLRSNLAQEEQFLSMFLDEARLAARLNHPNVVQTNDVGEDQGRYFLTMEHLEGQTLNRILKHHEAAKRFPRALRLHVLTRVLSGLHYAHELVDYDGRPLSVVHRDVSPSNIFVTYEGQVKLMDFGIAKAMDASSETRVGVFKGKAGYVAPEQVSDARNIDRRADIYALGIVLWETLTGERMWKGVSAADAMRRSANGDVPPLSVVAPDVPAELERICHKALARAPEDRYPSAAALEAALEAYLAAHPPRPSDREVASAMKSLFAEDRAQLRNAIEAQLKRPEGADQVPVIYGGLGGAATSSSSVSSSVSGVSATEAAKSNRAAEPITMGGDPADPRAPAAPVLDSALWTAQAPKKKLNRALAAIPAALVAGAALFFWLGGSKPTATPGDAPIDGARPAPAVAVRGVTDSEVLLGMSSAFSGPSRDLGNRMKLGVETAFAAVNDAGGVASRKLRLVALDDGYEGPRAGDNMKELLGSRGVFAVVGNVGTPTAQVAAPYAVANRTIFFGAFSGSKILRQEPPDRYVFNYRASYEEETATMVHYLVDAKKIPPAGIAVFAQHDSYGDAGFEGVAKTLRKHGRADSDILRVNYERNTVDVDAAVQQVLRHHQTSHPVRAIVMVATYKPAARFIQKIKDRGLDVLFLNVSFVGSLALAEELEELGPSYAPGVIVTQVVPHYESGGTGVLRYRDAFKKYHPDQQPDFVSLEGYVVGSLFAEGLRRAGREVTTEKLVDALESIRDHDMGIGTIVNFGLSQHQASHKVWGTVLDAEGHFQSLDMQ
jgi:serine/threonine protein kinase/ABC-type branched-subunit amino acid transport system substrate-binding protein